MCNDDWKARAEAAEAEMKGMSEELKPIACPFCEHQEDGIPKEDSEEVLSLEPCGAKDGFYAMMCDNCLAEGPPRRTPEEAVAAWNRRAETAELALDGATTAYNNGLEHHRKTLRRERVLREGLEDELVRAKGDWVLTGLHEHRERRDRIHSILKEAADGK